MILAAEVCEEGMEESLRVDSTTYDSPDVTKIDDSKTQLNLKPAGIFRLSFTEGVNPDALTITLTDQEDINEFVKYRFTIKTQKPTDAEPEDFNSGEVRSIVIFYMSH